MVKEFKSLKAFSTQLQKVVGSYERREKNLLEIVGRFVTIQSKSIIGHRQYVPGFAIWADLAESTKQEKEKLGYGNAGNDWQPLLRTGEMRDSISYSVELHQVHIGSTSEIMVYQEKGTFFIPARPVLSLTMYKEKQKLQQAVGDFMLTWIMDTRAKGKVV